MSIWTLVPVKPFFQSKTRLAPVLSPDARAGLSRDFLSHTLHVLVNVSRIGQIVVVSRDPAALALAGEWGALAFAEPDDSDLNTALTRATEIASANGASAVLALPTDLPFLSAEAVLQLINDRHSPAITIAPDRRDAGTNALFIRPPGLVPYAFGLGSFQRYLALAAQAGVSARICRSPALALDIDTPDDLRLLRRPQKI
jgi:2-phospho-L-lactate guanylyltransferase